MYAAIIFPLSILDDPAYRQPYLSLTPFHPHQEIVNPPLLMWVTLFRWEPGHNNTNNPLNNPLNSHRNMYRCW